MGGTIMEGVEENEGQHRPSARTVVGSNLGSTPIPSEPSRVAKLEWMPKEMWLAIGEAGCRMGAIFTRRLMQPYSTAPSLETNVLPYWRAHPPRRSRDAGDPGRQNLVAFVRMILKWSPGYLLVW